MSESNYPSVAGGKNKHYKPLYMVVLGQGKSTRQLVQCKWCDKATNICPCCWECGGIESHSPECGTGHAEAITTKQIEDLKDD